MSRLIESEVEFLKNLGDSALNIDQVHHVSQETSDDDETSELTIFFRDGDKDKKLTITTEEISLDLGGNFVNKGYNTRGGN